VEPFRAENNEEIASLFTRWLNPCDVALQQLEYFAGQFGSVAGAEEFHRCCVEAREIVAGWVPPVLSRAQGLHAEEFSADEAGKLREALQSGAARLRVQPRPVEGGEPA
jgi:hypothetical protein